MDSLGIFLTLNIRAEQHSAFGPRKSTLVLALLPSRLQQWAHRDPEQCGMVRTTDHLTYSAYGKCKVLYVLYTDVMQLK
jgi:hypothetical protein